MVWEVNDMSIDWDKIDDDIDTAADSADETLKSRISSLTRMKDGEIAELFPAQADKEKLVKLMQIVNEATAENQRTARLVDNIQELAGTAIKLLARYV